MKIVRIALLALLCWPGAAAAQRTGTGDPNLSPWLSKLFGFMQGPLRFAGYANGNEPVTCSSAEAGDTIFSTTDNTLRICNGTTWGGVGGGISGSGTTDRLAIWSGSGSLTSDADLTWTGGNTLGVTGTVAITGALSASGGAVTFGSLTASRAVFLDASSIVSTTGASAALAASVSDETGSGALVFGTTPTFTTSALFPDGSVGSPGIAFSGDTDTGVYRVGTNTIGIAAGGQKAASFVTDAIFGGGTATIPIFPGGSTAMTVGASGVDGVTTFSGGSGSVNLYVGTTGAANLKLVGNNTVFMAATGETGNTVSFTPARFQVSPTYVNYDGTPLFAVTIPNTGTVAAGTEAPGVKFDLASTRTFASGSNVTTQREYLVTAPTYAFSAASQVITNAATFAIADQPTAGTGATIQNPLAFWVQAGPSQFGATVKLADGTASVPGLAFTSGTSTGLLRQTLGGDSVLDVSVAGTTRYRFYHGAVTNGGLLVAPGGAGSIEPAVELAVYASSTPRIHVQNSTSGTSGSDGLQMAISGSDGYIWNWESGALTFATSNTQRLSILSGGTVDFSSTISKYNNVTTTESGVPSFQTTSISLTGQTADVSATNVKASAAAGRYRFCAVTTITTAASVSSTLPVVNLIYTDVNGGAVKTIPITSASLAANTTATGSTACGIANVSGSTNIQYSTSGYASVGGNAMQYDLYVTLETL